MTQEKNGALEGPSQMLEVEGPKYENLSVVSIVPTRGMVHCLAAQSWCNLQYPINHKHKGPMFVKGMQVDVAYEGGIGQIVASMPDYPFILTMEDDCAVPSLALVTIIRAMQENPQYDAVSALYCRKEEGGAPHVYGHPDKPGDWSLLDVRDQDGLVECNAIPMGFTVYRRSIFEDIPRPWFKNVQEIEDGNTVRISQDLFFCRKAREFGKRFAVHCGVKLAHIDQATDKLYYPYHGIETSHAETLDA